MTHSRLWHLSIRTQLIVAIVLATAVACVVAAGWSVTREVNAYADSKRIEIRAMAGLFAVMSSDAVKVGDSRRAYDAIGAMTSMPGVVYVRIGDLNGGTLAEHGFGSLLVARGDGLDFLSLMAGRPAVTNMPILNGGKTIGQVELLASTTDFRGRILGLIANAGIATLLALLLGVLTAHLLQRSVAGRLGAVVQAMSMVQRTHRYDFVLSDERQDEIGALADGFNRMIREIRTRDKRLADHRNNLEREVEERTFDLRIAKQTADDANAAKSQFLATMSHEIRTPLNGLMVMAELLAAAELHPRERRYADVVVRSGGSLLAIINDVLDYSKIEAGKIELETIELDLADVVDDVAQLFASKAEAQGLDLAAYVHPAIGRVLGDPVRIGQIVGNLVNNAIKFTPAGHVVIEVVPDPDRLGKILLTVKDTGIGIAADKLEKVFESFSQANQSTARHYGGTGLGLSICQRLVAAMGGEIGVSSQEGEGSCFWFSIGLAAAASTRIEPPRFMTRVRPGATATALSRYADDTAGADQHGAVIIVDPSLYSLAVAAPDLPPDSRIVVLSRVGDTAAERWVADGRALAQLPWPVRRSELLETVRAVASGKVTIASRKSTNLSVAQYSGALVLVVDDGAVNREVAIEALRRFGIVADTAVDGPDALVKVNAARYDLIFMDGSMPGMDGFETSRHIREMEVSRAVARQSIVALTAHALGDGADAWREAGMDGLLLKPFNLAQLGACLSQHLNPDDAARADVAAPHAPTPAMPSAQEAELLDPQIMETLAMLAEGSPDAVQRIIHIFVEHAPPALDRLVENAQTSSGEMIASAAHALKSMAMSVGAMKLAGVLGELEKAARHDGKVLSPDDLDHIRQLLAASTAALLALPWMNGTTISGASNASVAV